MRRWPVALSVIGVSVAGLLYLLSSRRRLLKRMEGARLFLGELQSYLQSAGQDAECYGWLIRRSSGMQLDMGEFGTIGKFRPPFANYMISNWAVVLNALSEMRKWASDGFRQPERLFYEYGHILQEALIRYVGALEDRDKQLNDSLRNPLIWFRHGVQVVLLFPFTVLRWLGLESIPTFTVLVGKPIVKVFAAVAAVVAFIASLVTIVEGWDKTVTLLHKVAAIF